MIMIMLILVFVCQVRVMAEEVTSYLLGPEDVLDFSVWNHPDLNKRVVVRSDGFISLPLIGELEVTGLQTEEVTERAEKLLEEYIQSPKVTISVVEFKKIGVSVMGAVLHSGALKVEPGTKLLEVLATAGIQEETALLEEVSLTRNNTVLKINVARLLREGGHQNYEMKSGDVIYIPVINREVYILGEVVRPGGYTIEEDTTPADILAMAGGPTDRADLEKVQIIRRDGKGESFTVNLENYLSHNGDRKVVYVQDGDVIQVLETRAINWEKIFTYVAGIKLIHDLIVNW